MYSSVSQWAYSKKGGTGETNKSTRFGAYLAGLIEGDGTIYTPPHDKPVGLIAYISIVFSSKDLALAEYLKSICPFFFYKKKGLLRTEEVTYSYEEMLVFFNLEVWHLWCMLFNLLTDICELLPFFY